MCKKQISALKNNEDGKVNFRISPLLLVGIFLLSGWACSGPSVPMDTDEVIIEHYPRLSEAIINRDMESLILYADHENPHVRGLAWRAVAFSETESIAQLTQHVMNANDIPGWLALSFHQTDSTQINRIMQLVDENPVQYGKACEFFRRQGDAGHLSLLMNLLDIDAHSERCAAAIGVILSRIEVSPTHRSNVIRAASNAENPVVRRNLLYGFYRSNLNRPEPGSEGHNRILEMWEKDGVGSDSHTDRYMVRILGEAGAHRVFLGSDEIASIKNVPLAVELARNIPLTFVEHDRQSDLIKGFLQHNNPHVVIQTLETLGQVEYSDQELNQFIFDQISSPTSNHEILITSLEYLYQQEFEIFSLEEKISLAESSNHYLTDRILGLYQSIWSEDQYLAKIEDHVAHGGIRGMHAIQSLTGFWAESDGRRHKEDIYRIVRKALERGDRSVVSGLQTLLTDEDLIAEDDFDWIDDAYSKSVQNENFENAEQLSEVLDTRFPSRFEQRHEEQKNTFRIPDWDKLYALGTRPHWRLETSKGDIEIRLDPLTAPFTVSSIDSLTRNGNYDGVVFHRVVRNFVVQGGDFDRKDGFGGPGYTIPTEPSEDSFERGVAGIASAGTDTEGSQFFFMHVWAPHLDGNYTNFGKVVRGMDVIDRLQIGDSVERASIIAK